jgi:hypothetical protein
MTKIKKTKEDIARTERELKAALSAIHVILLTEGSRNYLKENDPMALKQALGAIPIHTLSNHLAEAYGDIMRAGGFDFLPRLIPSR